MREAVHEAAGSNHGSRPDSPLSRKQRKVRLARQGALLRKQKQSAARANVPAGVVIEFRRDQHVRLFRRIIGFDETARRQSAGKLLLACDRLLHVLGHAGERPDRPRVRVRGLRLLQFGEQLQRFAFRQIKRPHFGRGDFFDFSHVDVDARLASFEQRAATRYYPPRQNTLPNRFRAEMGDRNLEDSFPVGPKAAIAHVGIEQQNGRGIDFAHALGRRLLGPPELIENAVVPCVAFDSARKVRHQPVVVSVDLRILPRRFEEVLSADLEKRLGVLQNGRVVVRGEMSLHPLRLRKDSLEGSEEAREVVDRHDVGQRSAVTAVFVAKEGPVAAQPGAAVDVGRQQLRLAGVRQNWPGGIELLRQIVELANGGEKLSSCRFRPPLEVAQPELVSQAERKEGGMVAMRLQDADQFLSQQFFVGEEQMVVDRRQFGLDEHARLVGRLESILQMERSSESATSLNPNDFVKGQPLGEELLRGGRQTREHLDVVVAVTAQKVRPAVDLQAGRRTSRSFACRT